MPRHQSEFDDFLNALECILKLVEQYKVQNVTYERDISFVRYERRTVAERQEIGANGFCLISLLGFIMLAS